MKILVPGNMNKLKKYKKFVCNDCGCVLVADNTEYVDYSNPRDGTMYGIECPCCKQNIWNYSNDCVEVVE